MRKTSNQEPISRGQDPAANNLVMIKLVFQLKGVLEFLILPAGLLQLGDPVAQCCIFLKQFLVVLADARIPSASDLEKTGYLAGNAESGLLNRFQQGGNRTGQEIERTAGQ